MRNMVSPTRSVFVSHRSKRTGLLAGTLAVSVTVLAGCQVNEQRLLAAPDDAGRPIPLVVPAVETAPVASSEDAADDAVILVADGGSTAWIAAADKKFGLRVYDLDGKEVDTFGTGRLNNVDAVTLGRNRFLLAASNRTNPAIELFRAEITGNSLQVTPAGAIPLTLDDPYGLCMADAGGRISVFVSDKDGRVEEWAIGSDLGGKFLRAFEFGSQTEGCVVDPAGNRLFVGEETVGIWSVDLVSGDMQIVDRVGAGRLTADVEGLDIYDGRYLLASSQGDNSFAVYALEDPRPIGRFRIGPNEARGIDGVSETDGIAVTAARLPQFPEGLLVAQDGLNVAPPENQNFKLVDWREIAAIIAGQE